MWSSGGWRKKGATLRDPNADQAASSSTAATPSSSSVSNKSSAASPASASVSGKRGSPRLRPSKKADANRQLANIIKRNRDDASVKQVEVASSSSRSWRRRADDVSRVVKTTDEGVSKKERLVTATTQRATTFPRRDQSPPGSSNVKRSFTGGKIGTLQKQLNLNALLAGGPPGGAGPRPRAMGSSGAPAKGSSISGVLTAAPMFLPQRRPAAKGNTGSSSVMTKDTKCPVMEHHTLMRPRRARTKRPSRPRFSQEAIATLASSPSSLLDDFDVPLLDDASWEDELAAS